MRAILITKQGDPVAKNIGFVEDHPAPSPGAGDVLIDLEASALNHRDLYLGRGLPGRDGTFPVLTGEDGCGRVSAVGTGVDEAWVGRRVIINAALPKTEPSHPDTPPGHPDRDMVGEAIPGTLGEQIAVPAANLADIGDTDAGEAAAYGLVHLTAWRMLVTRAGLRPGMSVLIPGIGGGVALALLNIARHFGCTTVVTSRHQWKLDRASDLGADHGILDTGESFHREVRAATHRRGVDICADSVGKAIHLAAMRSLARGGVFVTCGTTSGGDAVTDLTRVFWNECTIIGSTMGGMGEFRQAIALLRSGHLRPVIDKRFPAADGAAAFERLESGEHFGKIVIEW